MTDTYKVLGQITGTTAYQSIYTVPSATEASLSNMSVLNTGSSATYSIAAVKSSEYNGILEVDTYIPPGWNQKGSTFEGSVVAEVRSFSAMSDDGLNIVVVSSNPDLKSSAKVFQWNGSEWVQRGSTIFAESVDSTTYASVDMSADGNVFAVGSRLNDDGDFDAGSVRVYEWNGSDWSQMGQDLDGTSAFSYFGYSVSLSGYGNIVAIGGYGGSGVVRVYQFDEGTSQWIQRGSDLVGETNSGFGYSVAIDGNGNRLVVGAPFAPNNAFEGRVYFFSYSGGSYNQVGYPFSGLGWYGASVDIDGAGDYVVVGSPNRYSFAGVVDIMSFTGAYTINSILGNAVNDYSGRAVSISGNGNRIAVSSTGYQIGSGLVKLYDWNGSTYTQVGEAIIPSIQQNQLFGFDLAISGNGSVVAVGALNVEGQVIANGSVRVYEYDVDGTTTYTPVPENKHFIVKSKAIASGEHHTFTGGITLEAGDRLLVSSSSGVVTSVYGVEIS